MNMIATLPRWGDLIHQNRVHGSLYRDPAIFAQELEQIWYRTWVYVGHESEIPNPHDYVAKSIGLQPILMTRDANGAIHLLLNRCTHRGNQVCAREKATPRLSPAPSIHGTSAVTAAWSDTRSPTGTKVSTRPLLVSAGCRASNRTGVSSSAPSPNKAPPSRSISAAPRRRSTVWS